MGIYLSVSIVILALAFIFSMLGLGGAMLYIPVFKWFGFNFKSVAIPTGLFLNGITATSAAIYYIKNKMADIKGAIPMVITSFLGAPVGAYFTKFVPTSTLIILFAIGMVAAGGRMLFSAGQAEPTQMMPYKKRAIITGIASFFIGMIAGLLGIGGGFLFVPMMIAVGYPTKKAAATSAFIVIFSSFSGFFAHVAEGHFNLKLLIFTSIAVIIGSQIGARIMKQKMKAKWIKQAFGVLLVLVAIKLVWKVLG